MAGNNAIGSGVLVLSANADGLLAGLNKVEAQTKTFAKNQQATMKTADPTGGGLFSKIASGGGILKGLGNVVGKIGGAAGGALGAASAVASGVIDVIGGAIDSVMHRFDDLALRARGADRGSLRAIQGSMNILDGVKLDFLQKVANALAPVMVNLADAVMNFWKRIEPFVTKVLDGFGTLAFVGVEIASDIANGISDVVSACGEWVASILGINTESLSMQKVVLDVLRGVAKGFAYVWDTIKAGAGVISVVAGVIVEGLSLILQQVAKAVKGIAELGASLPDAIRPDWLGKAADAADSFLAKSAEVGAKMRENGLNAIAGWGEGVKAIDPWFDAVEKKLDKTKEGIGELKLLKDIQLTGGFQKGSAEAYHIVARYDATDKLNTYNKQMIDLQRQAVGALKIIAGGNDKNPIALKAW